MSNESEAKTDQPARLIDRGPLAIIDYVGLKATEYYHSHMLNCARLLVGAEMERDEEEAIKLRMQAEQHAESAKEFNTLRNIISNYQTATKAV